MGAKKIYIGLVGEKGGGKDTVMKFIERLLPKKKIVQIRFQDVLTETLTLWELPRTRENYQKLSPAFRRAFGPRTITNVARARALRADADILILNGIRWWEDFTMLRSLNKEPGAKSFVVYITAPLRIRYERTRARSDKTGEGKTGESKISFAKFMKQERAFTEKFIKQISKKADVTIGNTGTMNEFREAVRARILPLIVGRKL